MPTVLPVPTLDHVVVNVRDRIDAGAECFRRLGFALTPRGYHTLGSMNHLAMFGTEYLELIAAPPGSARQDILEAPEGLNGLVFASEDAGATYQALHAAGLPVDPAQQFSRPVELPGGAQDATFRTVRLRPGAVAAGRVYFCQHLTRDLVWRDEWRHHPNGAIGVRRAVIADADPSALAGLFARMFGADTVRQHAEGYSLVLGLAQFDLVTPSTLRREFGDAAPHADGRDSFMAALTLRTLSLDTAATALAKGGVAAQRKTARIIVPAAQAFGVTLEFCE